MKDSDFYKSSLRVLIKNSSLSPFQSGQLVASLHQPWPDPVYSPGRTILSPHMTHQQELYPGQM